MKEMIKIEVRDELRKELVTREIFDEALKNLQNEMREGFNVIDEKFKGVDEKFKVVDERFKSLEDRMDENLKLSTRNSRASISS